MRSPSGYDLLRGPNNERLAWQTSDAADVSDEESSANIHLMAAAPELLAEVEDLIVQVHSEFCFGEIDSCERCRPTVRLIARAKGDL